MNFLVENNRDDTFAAAKTLLISDPLQSFPSCRVYNYLFKFSFWLYTDNSSALYSCLHFFATMRDKDKTTVTTFRGWKLFCFQIGWLSGNEILSNIIVMVYFSLIKDHCAEFLFTHLYTSLPRCFFTCIINILKLPGLTTRSSSKGFIPRSSAPTIIRGWYIPKSE